MKNCFIFKGFGFTSRYGEADEVSGFLDFFKQNDKYSATLFGGVPTHWRELNGDSKTDPKWADVYAKYDIISPWLVGRFRTGICTFCN